MKHNDLTDAECRQAKPAIAVYTLFDGGGLFMEILPTGTKCWRLKYRYGGKAKRLFIGAYPAVTLASARAKRLEARAALDKGIDPSVAKRTAKIEQAANTDNTFQLVADEYLAKQSKQGLATGTLRKNAYLLGKATAAFGAQPIGSITAPEILRLLRGLESTDNSQTAVRVRAIVGAVFRYGIATGKAERDPAADLRGALAVPPVKHHAALTDAKAVGGLMRAIAGYNGQPETRLALQVLAYTFVRPGELRLASWAEFDLAAMLWRIPAERTKMRKEHLVPLAPQTMAVLSELHQLTGHRPVMFPSVHSGHKVMSENTLNTALRRMGYSNGEMTSHGFRATASTLLNESGLWQSDTIERALAHAEKDEVRRAYARGQHWEERVKMAAWWCEYLDGLRGGI